MNLDSFTVPVAKLFGFKDRAKSICSISAGTVGPYSAPGRVDFWYADADVRAGTAHPERRFFASGRTLSDALRKLADRIDDGDSEPAR